jgi:replicative DNA helicase
MVQSLDDARRNRNNGAGRVPPHDLAAEASLLGAMLLSPNAIGAAAEVHLTASDFYKPAHGHIYDAIEALYHRGEPADPVTVSDELHRDGLLEAIGGPGTLVEIQTGTPAISNAARYARIVEEFSQLRRLIGVAAEIADLGYSLPDDVATVLDRAETLVFDVKQRRLSDDMMPVGELLTAALDKLEALYDRGEAVTGVPTGFDDLDHRLAGLQPNNLVVVGARPAVGKTSFALGILAHAAMEAGVPTLLFSLEMGRDEITQRLLCSEARVDAGKLRTGNFDERDWQKITAAVGRLAEAPIFIDDNPNVTVMDIRAKARRLKARDGLGLIIIDYMQLMTGRGRAENRQVEVAEMSRSLKILARELEIPVMALSQLSRTLEQRQDKRPMLSDLRESGCLTANSRVLRADTGAEVTMGELLLTGERNIPVWSLDENLRVVPATMTHVFPSGIKEVFALRLASGRVVEASANHPFRTLNGWKALEDLAVGSRLASVDDAAAPIVGAVVTPVPAELRPQPVALLTEPDLVWDTVVAIEPLGPQPVYDATVLGTHNFIANGIAVHNSLEQDADVVMFLYRDELYHPDSADKGIAEVIVAKHRSGPTGVTQLAFLPQYTRFASMPRTM